MCCDRIFLNINFSCHNPHQSRKDPAGLLDYSLHRVLPIPLQLVATSIEEASAKLPVSLGHYNDRLSACNLACAAEHVSLIFAGSHRDNVALSSRLLRGERNKCPVLRVSASRQVEASRDASPFLHHFNACHTSALSNALQQQSLLLLREQTLLPEKPGGLSDVIARRVPSSSVTAPIFDY